jgi:hypothetical protein
MKKKQNSKLVEADIKLKLNIKFDNSPNQLDYSENCISIGLK